MRFFSSLDRREKRVSCKDTTEFSLALLSPLVDAMLVVCYSLNDQLRGSFNAAAGATNFHLSTYLYQSQSERYAAQWYAACLQWYACDKHALHPIKKYHELYDN